MNKKEYENPVIQITKFEVDSIITLSTQGGAQNKLGSTSYNSINNTDLINF